MPWQMPFAESDRVDLPVSLYGATKRADELLARAYFASHALHSTALRFFTVYGEWGRPDMAPAAFAFRIDRGIPIRLFAGGAGVRDFTYVRDIAAGVLAAAALRAAPDERGCPVPEVFNLGGGHKTSVLQLVSALETLCGRRALQPSAAAAARGEVGATHADASRAARLLGWRARTPLRTGLAALVAWIRSRPSPPCAPLRGLARGVRCQDMRRARVGTGNRAPTTNGSPTAPGQVACRTASLYYGPRRFHLSRTEQTLPKLGAIAWDCALAAGRTQARRHCRPSRPLPYSDLSFTKLTLRRPPSTSAYSLLDCTPPCHLSRVYRSAALANLTGPSPLGARRTPRQCLHRGLGKPVT